MVALTDYDVRLQEDDEISKLTHDRQIFKSIVESQWFADKEIILFFNKCDLFETKDKAVSTESHIPGIWRYEN